MASNPVHRYVFPEMPLPSNDPPATNIVFCWQMLMYSKLRMSTLVVPSIALYLTARKVITESFRAYSVSGSVRLDYLQRLGNGWKDLIF